MNSCLFQCDVMHHRLYPKAHRFSYKIFMFYLDLDELDTLHQTLKLFSRNTFNWFTFRDEDHMQFQRGKTHAKDIKSSVNAFLKSNDIAEEPDRIMLLTNTAVMGYAFNPISVYLCFNAVGDPSCSVAEVCNTHGEMKMFLLDQQTFNNETFDGQVKKNFYVSPFVNLEAAFRFIFKIPKETLHFRVDDYEDDKRFLLSSLTGIRKELTDARLFRFGLQFPLITIRIMFLIHWQAIKLWLKRIPYENKNHNLHLQKEMVNYKKS
jgi:DUF1365 family protein